MIIMLTVVADTGAAVSLALSGMLGICRKNFRIIIGEKIAEELKEISSRDDELAGAAKHFLKEAEIISASGNFGKGEDEALELLSHMKADILISDDIEFVRKNRNNEKISFSVVLFGILLEKKIITKREWEENLIYLVAKNMLE